MPLMSRVRKKVLVVFGGNDSPGDLLSQSSWVWWVKLDTQTHGEWRLGWKETHKSKFCFDHNVTAVSFEYITYQDIFRTSFFKIRLSLFV